MLKLMLISLLIAVANGRKYPDYVPAEVITIIETFHEICLPKAGVTIDDVANYELTNKDPKMMCYMKCMMLEADWMTSDGTIQFDKIIKKAYPGVKDVLEAAVNKCRNIEDGTHECEKPYNFQTCLYNADPEHWFLP